MSASHHSHPIQLANPFNLSALLHLPESNIIWLHCDKVTVNGPWHVNNWSWIQPPVQHTAEEQGKLSPVEKSLGLPTNLGGHKGCRSWWFGSRCFHILSSTDAYVNAHSQAAHKHTQLPTAIRTILSEPAEELTHCTCHSTISFCVSTPR